MPFSSPPSKTKAVRDSHTPFFSFLQEVQTQTKPPDHRLTVSFAFPYFPGKLSLTSVETLTLSANQCNFCGIICVEISSKGDQTQLGASVYSKMAKTSPPMRKSEFEMKRTPSPMRRFERAKNNSSTSSGSKMSGSKNSGSSLKDRKGEMKEKSMKDLALGTIEVSKSGKENAGTAHVKNKIRHARDYVAWFKKKKKEVKASGNTEFCPLCFFACNTNYFFLVLIIFLYIFLQ